MVLGVDEEITTELLGLGGSQDDLEILDNLPYHDAIEQFSRHILEKAMRRSNWSQSKAAELLSLQRTYLSSPSQAKKHSTEHQRILTFYRIVSSHEFLRRLHGASLAAFLGRMTAR